MATIAEIQKFLNDFHQKVEIFDIFFLDDREKNANTIDELGIIRGMRKEVIQSLTVDDYSEGPIKNILNTWGDLWVFGKDVEGREVYIKISYGKPNRRAICISFHLAEFPMKYPYKKGGKSL
ncbi:MAG: type II toxin-antitoxin system MqsR family toxin [Paludibacteraceae bacterium]|nr:type II toxin-antitoxin system MqsR family toxin [Paludibacteraceae bacterium]